MCVCLTGENGKEGHMESVENKDLVIEGLMYKKLVLSFILEKVTVTLVTCSQANKVSYFVGICGEIVSKRKFNMQVDLGTLLGRGCEVEKADNISMIEAVSCNYK